MRLCVRISNCSRESLSMNGERITVYLLILVGSGTGPATRVPVRGSRLDDLGRGLIEDLVIVCLEPDADFLGHGGSAVPLLLLRRSYLSIEVTAPAPTVRPPSRMAKRMPSSTAIGVISSMPISMLSPGMHISWPSGSSMVPVTSVVRM